MEIESILNILKSFLPFSWSKDPWDMPIIKIKTKHIIDEILKLLNLKKSTEKILQNKKKIKECFRLIFLIWLFISKIIVLKKSTWAF